MPIKIKIEGRWWAMEMFMRDGNTNLGDTPMVTPTSMANGNGYADCTLTHACLTRSAFQTETGHSWDNQCRRSPNARPRQKARNKATDRGKEKETEVRVEEEKLFFGNFHFNGIGEGGLGISAWDESTEPRKEYWGRWLSSSRHGVALPYRHCASLMDSVFLLVWWF